VDIERARYLVSAAGREALESGAIAELGGHEMARAMALRRRFPSGEAAALGEQLALRDRARERGLPATRWLYTTAGQQMMTHPLVAGRRARRLGALRRPVVDLTCGIGGDLGCISAEATGSVGVDRDPVAALLARANVPGATILQGDAARPPLEIGLRSVVIDPARRDERGRRFDPAAFAPGWETCIALARQASTAVLKAPPGLDRAHTPADAEIEFVQLGRTLREAALWFGAGACAGLRRAVLLPAGATLDSTADECEAGAARVGRMVLDPEGCITRAGLVRHLAAQTGGRLVDANTAWITGDNLAPSPFGTRFEILDSVPFSVRRLREILRTRGWRPDQIRRRAFPIEPDELRRLLHIDSGEPVTLLCTTVAGGRVAWIGRPLVDETAGQ
jgi:hypothetical protein